MITTYALPFSKELSPRFIMTFILKGNIQQIETSDVEDFDNLFHLKRV